MGFDGTVEEAAFVRKPWPEKPPAFVGVLDNVRSLHNVGSIFRSADGAGFGGLILCGMTGTPPRAEIRKTALGAEECVPWRYMPSTEEAIAWLREEGYVILALEKTPNSIPFYRLDVRPPVALIVGHEFHGISGSILSQCDMAAHLPMRGCKISLNVSVAFGIAAYELTRKVFGDT